jgi:hypothetical protein
VPLESAEDCDAKAARARAIAERLTDPDAINTMLRIAWYYDWIAAYARADAATPALANDIRGSGFCSARAMGTASIPKWSGNVWPYR